MTTLGTIQGFITTAFVEKLRDEEPSTIDKKRIDQVCGLIDKIIMTDGTMSPQKLEAAGNHVRGVFTAALKARKDLAEAKTQALNEMKAKIEETITNHQDRLEVENSISVEERLKAKQLTVVTLDGIAESIQNNIAGASSNPSLNVEAQRGILFKIAATCAKAENAEAFNQQFSKGLTEHIQEFSKEGLAALEKEIRRECVLAKHSDTVAEKWKSLNIVMAGPEAIMEGKNHPLYALATLDQVKTTKVDLQAVATMEAGEADKLAKETLDKLQGFWKQDGLKEKLIESHGVKFDTEGKLIPESLSADKKDAYILDIGDRLTKYMNESLTDQERAMAKQLALRSTASLQASKSFMDLFKGLASGTNLSSLLSSGVFGLLAGKMLSPMFGLVVTVISFLLNSSSSTADAKAKPPAPATATPATAAA